MILSRKMLKNKTFSNKYFSDKRKELEKLIALRDTYEAAVHPPIDTVHILNTYVKKTILGLNSKKDGDD